MFSNKVTTYKPRTSSYKYFHNIISLFLFSYCNKFRYNITLNYNVNYINEFPLIHYDKRWPTLEKLSKYVAEKSGYKFNYKLVNKYEKQWYANNSLIRNEFPIKENDSGIHQIYDMFNELCKHRVVPDVEFFVNKRDFPLLKKNETEPYECIYGNNTPLLSHNYDKYCPILSQNGNEKFADILIPTWEDWSRVRNIDDKLYFPKPCVDAKPLCCSKMS